MAISKAKRSEAAKKAARTRKRNEKLKAEAKTKAYRISVFKIRLTISC